MKKGKTISTKISDDAIYRWHLFAAENRLKKAPALEEIIKRGTNDIKGSRRS